MAGAQLYEVVFDTAARQDLKDIFDYISGRASLAIAETFVLKLYHQCIGLRHVPERGTRRDELRPGLRTLGYRRRATILFEVDHSRHQVTILGIYYGVRNYADDFTDESD